MNKPDYGIDAPGVIRNLLLVALAGVLVALFAPEHLHLGPIDFAIRPMGWGFLASCGTPGILMILYSKVGKFKHRDWMLGLHTWRGDEKVLDVGTGRGLLLVGAAKRLTTGRATGLDVWNKEDLSGNSLETTEANLALEGVSEKCSLVSEGAQEMNFPDETFDVVVSNLCLHNIYSKGPREQACREIARVLKRGGLALIADYKLTGEYAQVFREAGLQVEMKTILSTFPPIRTVVAKKPG